MAVPNRKRASRQLTIKVLVLGERNVGKSATIVRFLTHRFIGHYGSFKDWIYKQPIAHDAKKNLTTSVELQEQTIQYCNEDNYDNDDNNSNGAQLKAKMFWADAFIVIYAINDRNSFDRARYYLKAIDNIMINLNEQQTTKSIGVSCNDLSIQLQTKIKRPILLLANKCDLSRDGRQVLGFEGHSLAALHRCLFSEISAAESHLGICNTFKALLIQANSLPSQTTTVSSGSDYNNRHIAQQDTKKGIGRPSTDINNNSNNNNSNISKKISTKLNNNLHDRYDSIKSSFRRASLAIVSSKTFVNHHKKHHHKKQAATKLLSSNSDYSSGDLLQTIDNNNNNRCFSIGTIGDVGKQQTIADSNGSLDKLSRGRSKRKGLFKYKQRRTTITVTGLMMATTNSERVLKEQQKLIMAPKQEIAITTDVKHSIRRQKSYSLNQENKYANRQCSSTSDVLDDDNSHDEDKLNNSLDVADYGSNAHLKLFQLSSTDSTNLTNNDSNERSLSRGSCSSCKSTDNSNGYSSSKRNVSKLLSKMFNRPSSVIDGSIVTTEASNHHYDSNSNNQLYTSSSIYSKSVPLYNQFSRQQTINNSQLQNGDIITKLFNDASTPTCNQNNNDDQLTSSGSASRQTIDATNKQCKSPIELVPYTSIRNYPICQLSSQFHQASCARQLAPILSRRNRRWYRLIGH